MTRSWITSRVGRGRPAGWCCATPRRSFRRSAGGRCWAIGRRQLSSSESLPEWSEEASRPSSPLYSQPGFFSRSNSKVLYIPGSKLVRNSLKELRDNPVLLHCAPTLLGPVIPNHGNPAQLRLLPVSSLRGNISSEPDSAVFGTPFNDFRIFHTAWSIAKNFSDTANVVSD